MFKQPGRAAAVRRLFEEMGGNVNMTTLARKTLERGIYTEGEFEVYAIRRIADECRRYLTSPDESGLRFAGMAAEQPEIPSGGPVWRVRPIWSLPDYRLNIGELMRNRTALTTEIEALRAECRERLGADPVYGAPLTDPD